MEWIKVLFVGLLAINIFEGAIATPERDQGLVCSSPQKRQLEPRALFPQSPVKKFKQSDQKIFDQKIIVKQQRMLRILNECLHNPNWQELITKNRSYLEDQNIQYDTVISLATALRRSYGTIQKPGLEDKVFTPAARMIFPRTTITELLNDGVISPLPNDYDQAPELEETPEEKAARIELMERLYQNFKEQEAQRNISDHDLANVLSWEQTIFTNFFNYRQIIENNGGKSKRNCLEEGFKKFVGDQYNSFIFGKYVVFYSPRTLDGARKNLIGHTNLQLLQNGRAPIGADCESMNLHHLTGHDPGYVVLISSSFHRTYSSKLHSFHQTTKGRASKIDRLAFAKTREKIFIYMANEGIFKEQ